MSAAKIGLLLAYILAIATLVIWGETMAGMVALWFLIITVAVHVVEVVLYLPLAKRAGGSLPAQLFQVFLFGVLHKAEMETAAGKH